jgi:hypothetical protein
MQKIRKEELKERLRNTFHDQYAIQWSDSLLDEILIEAQREYALYSGELLGRYEVSVSASLVQTLPEDFFQVIAVISPEGRNIPVVSYRYLAEKYGDFRNIRGKEVKYLCFNFDSFGKFRTFPLVPEGTFIGSIIYKRLPHNEEWINGNWDAIEDHALYQMCQFTGKAMAKNYFTAFMDKIYRTRQKNLEAGNKKIVRTGVYF